MTIPFQTPQIGTTGVVQAPNPVEQLVSGFQVVQLALQKRQELEQARQELAQRREQFELNKKIAGSTLAGMELDQEKKKRDMKAAEDDLAAQSEALRVFTGSIPELGNPQGIGHVIAGIKDPKVAAHFFTLLQAGLTTQNLSAPNQEIRPSPNPTSPSGYEYIGINPRDPTQTVNTGRAAPNPNVPTQRIPVVTEREKASAAVGAAQANAVVNRLEASDPGIAARVAKRVAAYRAGLSAVGKRLLGASPEDIALAAESQIEQSMSPEELQFYQASKQWLASVLPGLSGKQVTAREYIMQAPPYFSMGATNPQVMTARRKARATRTRGFIFEAGDAMNERLQELPDPQEYGLGTVMLPDSTQHVITPGRARYHPRFRTDTTTVKP